MKHNLISEIRVAYSKKKGDDVHITSSKMAFESILPHYPKDTIALQEQFLIMYLNRVNKVIGVYHAFTGGITSTVVDIRIILAVALKSMACGMIISHNHPSGVIKPSLADNELTNKIKEASRLMDIELLDHIIVSPDRKTYYSFKDEGEL